MLWKLKKKVECGKDVETKRGNRKQNRLRNPFEKETKRIFTQVTVKEKAKVEDTNQDEDEVTGEISEEHW